jgi:hypothetical protein
MNGRVIIVEGYSKALIQANPDVLFAFEDNLQRVGFIGQSAAARGCPNAVGIPTKISPTEHIFDDLIGHPIKEVDFGYDGPYGHIILEIIKAFATLRNHLRAGGSIAWPKEGVGAGESRLIITAPILLQGIEACKTLVFLEAVSITQESHK